VYRWGQRFLPSLHVAARRHRQAVGVKWRVDETYCRLSGRWAYCYRAIDQHGQVVDVLFSERRTAVAARRVFERAIARSRVAPPRATTDRAAAYPPALRQLLPAAEHRCSKYLNNGIERDHQHLKQRLRPMRGFKRLHSAATVTRGHALVQNLRNGFSALTVGVPRQLRLATAWPELLRVI
jgi:transposase, IS6 family